MKNAILIHGSSDEEEYFSDKYPSLSNSHWLPWLQKQLLINGIFTQTPEMPNSYTFHYKYDEWKKEISRYDINKKTILVGFSMGGGFLLRYLSENKLSINKLILIAPWIDPSRRETTDFFDFNIDSDLVNRIIEIHIFYSLDDDTEGLQGSMERIQSSLKDIKVHKFTNMGHFVFESMNTEKFPELLEIILK